LIGSTILKKEPVRGIVGWMVNRELCKVTDYP